MTNSIHETNRQCWDKISSYWKELRDHDNLWQRIPAEPDLAFEGDALHFIQTFCDDLEGKDVCIIGSGFYIFYDIHPFQRPWRDQVHPIQMEKPYWDTSPFQDDTDGTFEFNWTLADLLNPLADAGLVLKRIIESPAKDARFWEGHSYEPGTNSALMDWHNNPRAGLPVWLTVCAQKHEYQHNGRDQCKSLN